MRISTLATAAPALPAARPTSPAAAPAIDDRNPWGFPKLDSTVAGHALDGLAAGVTIVNRLIDRSFAVRTLLDRDLKAGVFASDTVHAVELLTRARDYALGTLEERHLSTAVTEPVLDWIRANRDERIRVVNSEISALQDAVTNLLDDDEGNVREEITQMRTEPDRRLWQSIRDGVDGSIANLYEARDVSASQHVLRAAGGLR